MNHLRPEKRMDKTGKLVTRHVRDDTSATSTVSQIPPPTVTPEPSRIILPEDEATPMTAKDWAVVADVLDMCNSDDLAHVSPYIRTGEMDAIKLFHRFGEEHAFSTIIDVLEVTHALPKPENYSEAMAAHMMIAASGSFDYFDIHGVPDHEAVLEIIHENSSQADSILSFLKKRPAEPNALREHLSNSTKALREGTL